MQTNNELQEKAYKLGFTYEAERGSCPQCVLAAVYETISAGDIKTIQAADALAGGTVLSTKGTCGALVGGLLAISSLAGRDYKAFSSGKKQRDVFELSKPLYDKFIEEYGSILCCDVHKKLFGRTFNLMDAKDYQEFEKLGAHVDKCPVVSGNVARWAVEIILEKIKKI
ncbi:MAG: C-GCAxxG-C-C family protein [Thermoplasmatota archaeon]